MNIRIDDDVPLPEPSKPDTWVTGPKAAPHIVYESNPSADNWVKERFIDATKRVAMKDLEPVWTPVEQLQRYPAETTYDAKGVPTVDCLLVGGPLNGQHGPIVGTAKTVELEVYAADGSVSSVEFYELGAKGDLQGRYWAGTKGKQQCDLCKDWFALSVVSDKGYCAECQAELIEVRRNLNRT